MRGFVILSLGVLAAANYLVEPLGGNEEESKFLGFSNMPFSLGNSLSPRKKHRVDGGSGGGTAQTDSLSPAVFSVNAGAFVSCAAAVDAANQPTVLAQAAGLVVHLGASEPEVTQGW